MKRLYILFITAILLCTALSAQEADIRKVAERYKGINLLSTGNCKIINLSEENILWGFKI